MVEASALVKIAASDVDDEGLVDGETDQVAFCYLGIFLFNFFIT